MSFVPRSGRRHFFEEWQDFEVIHEDQDFVGDAEVGDDREGQKVETHIGQLAVHFGPCQFELAGFVGYFGGSLIGEEPGDGQGDMGENFSLSHDTNSPLGGAEGFDSNPHVGFAFAGDDEVMGIVANRAGHRSFGEAKILEESVRNFPMDAMTLDHGDVAEAMASQ